jgi:F-type H+-transporting ATPase subunit a
LALFIRDEVVRPTIGDPHAHHGDDDGHASAGGHGHARDHGPGGHVAVVSSAHPADRYLPFVWSCFFYVLICNLLGAIPFLGSATGSLNVTGVLALSAMAASFAFGVQQMGFAGFWLNLVPGLEIPGLMKPLILGLMFVIEVVGFFIKHGVLAVRLFANIMGGHTVLGVMLGFIGTAAVGVHAGTLPGGSAMYWLIAVGSVGGQIGIGLLELFVAFLQAYVFAYLSTIFISMSVHHH